ncbi:polysaccharide biosynthesis protein [Clostridium sp. AM58-1XD]|uniref:putative polysaccharide biosynthesis protein n=1 Tax=Clostridium sp. AM58-1XD TaxID=2292307 RepID=UPI000E480572|nr:polysaccharide biosynthesis protein [Clostridium sp. AM58-1XD]RGZ01489.1 polysaccharide biosynthesis protein [Clostridium sp. AM58-1XD]
MEKNRQIKQREATQTSQTNRKKSKGANFIIQGSILAVAGIIVRLIGMVYRIPLINIIGKEGNGYYTAAYDIYVILLIVSSYSLPTAVSKMVAAKLGRGEYRNSARILKTALWYATVVGGIGAVILWFGADALAGLLRMPYCRYAMQAFAPTIWIMAYLGVLRGYFQGTGNMVPTAISQILEQLVNAVVSIGAASFLFTKGLAANAVHDSENYAYAYGAAGGTIGTGAGALAAFLFFLLLFWMYRPVLRRQKRKDTSRRLDSYRHVTLIMTMTIVPIVLSSAVYNVSAVVDNYFFSHGMEKLGMMEEIATQWGTFGQYHLLFNIPVAISNALSSSLIPSLTRAVACHDRRETIDKVQTAIRFSMIIAIPSAVGLCVLAGPINNLLFTGGENELLIKITISGALAVVFFSLSTVSNAILQGINRMNVPMKNAAISLIVHIGALEVMLLVFKWGLYSVVFANIIFSLLMCQLNAAAIRRYLHYRQEVKKTFLLPIIAALLMGAASYGTYHGVFAVCRKNAVGTLAAILVAVAVYGVLLIKLHCIDERELKKMPGGTRLFQIARKLHLM